MKAMILAAGLGTRLRPITYGVPKPMVPVLNRPVMEHTARLLARHGLTEAIANLHWFPETIESHFGDGSAFGLELSYSFEQQLLGTAGGVRNVAEFLGESFLVVAGDALTDIDFGAMREFHESHDGLVTMATKRVADTDQFGVVIAAADARIQGFQEKPDPAEALSDLANTCIYMFRAEVFDHFPEPGTSNDAGPDDPPEFADWAKDVFPALLEADVPFYSHEIDAYWNDIGNLDELRQGNLDALRGEVEVEPGAPQVADGVRSASPLDGVEVTAPALIGTGVEIGADVKIDGPAIVADGCRIGAGSIVRDAILLEGTELPPSSILVGGIAAHARQA
ncbi:MAG TPA: NDP-sugar synthase [Solirubrobacterales bacterium]|jgi:mannose-1-phosphate guanylyltransferase/mannose-1-phosphate guanylyltransferase/phosphomannomutase